VDRKSERRYDNCLKYTVVSGKKALIDAGLAPDSEAFGGLDKERCGLLIGTGMGGLTIFQDGVKDLVNKGPKKMSPFFIPYAITNM
jgi:3-oxoacyl-[acyl-carrier-protein] synthase II